MRRVTLLISVLFSLVFYVQAQEKPKAYKFFEFGKISNRLLKEKFEAFSVEVGESKSNKGKGYIIYYMKPRDAALFEARIIRLLPSNCGYDGEKCARFRFVYRGNSKKGKTEFWVVPEGAEEPISEPN
jgi:hypothetical protein